MPETCISAQKDITSDGQSLAQCATLKAKKRSTRRKGGKNSTGHIVSLAPGVDAERAAAFEALQSLGGSPDQPIMLMDLSKAQQQLELWCDNLPRVRPHYAVKCNPDRQLLQTLKSGGCGFDCATMDEIERALSIGVHPDDIVFSHPCKLRSHLTYAKSKGVGLMSFDNALELKKVAAEYPNARMLLRLVCDDAGAQCPMSLKFGAAREIWASLLDLCVELKLQLAGVSFHVGSGCKDPRSFERALQDAREVFNLATARGLSPDTLDIGGGFPSSNDGGASVFIGIARIISVQLELNFPASEYTKLRIMAEPGRFFAGSMACLLTKVYAKAELTSENSEEGSVFRYYLNDGLYGSFNCVLYDHAVVVPEPLETPRNPDLLRPCCLFGPTCDGFDMILADHKMPELFEGDWIIWRNMGAYTSAAGSKFNGFPQAICWHYRLHQALTKQTC